MGNWVLPLVQGGLGAASEALGAGGNVAGIGGSAGPSVTSSAMDDRSPINIAPVGVNLGAILQPFDQGGVSNGGAGLDMLSRYLTTSDTGRVSTPLTTPVDTGNTWIWVAVAGAGLVAVFLFMRKGK